MRRLVYLHGPFKAFSDGPIEVIADTVWDAIEAVTLQIKGFKPDLHGRKRVQVAGFDTIESLRQPSDVKDIHLIPHMVFGKNNGLVQVVVGAVLIVAGVLVTPLNPQIGAGLIASGIGMVIGGLIQILTPQPKASDPTSVSRYIPSNQNTVKIGTTIPLLYGEGMCAGQIMSLEIVSNNTPTS